MREGGAVAQANLMKRIRKAHKLALASDRNGILQSVAALKSPSQKSVAKLFSRAGIERDSSRFRFELGWVVTTSESRGQGFGNMIVDRLLKKTKRVPLYALCREDNVAMQAILTKHSFAHEGKKLRSSRTPARLYLYVRDPTGCSLNSKQDSHSLSKKDDLTENIPPP